jgi:DeoR family galactitol utilization operon repressor
VDEILADRHKIILELMAEKGHLSVNQLCETLGVSAVTVRSDLSELEDRGFINRTHGGAVPALNANVLERKRRNLEEKTRIAKAAADMVQDGDTLMIEAGTTTALIAKFLFGKRDIHIVTNSTLAFANARANPQMQISIVGGEFRRASESLVGPIALQAIERLNVSLAFVGTDGFTVEKGMTTHLIEGAEVVAAMVRQARTSVLVADSSKYGKTGFVSVLPLSAVDFIITDAKLDQAARERLESKSISVRYA